MSISEKSIPMHDSHSVQPSASSQRANWASVAVPIEKSSPSSPYPDETSSSWANERLSNERLTVSRSRSSESLESSSSDVWANSTEEDSWTEEEDSWTEEDSSPALLDSWANERDSQELTVA